MLCEDHQYGGGLGRWRLIIIRSRKRSLQLLAIAIQHGDLLHLLLALLRVLLVAPLAHRGIALGLLLLVQVGLLLARLGHFAKDRRVQLLLRLLGLLPLVPDQRDLVLGRRVLRVLFQNLKGGERNSVGENLKVSFLFLRFSFDKPILIK